MTITYVQCANHICPVCRSRDILTRRQHKLTFAGNYSAISLLVVTGRVAEWCCWCCPAANLLTQSTPYFWPDCKQSAVCRFLLNQWPTVLLSAGSNCVLFKLDCEFLGNCEHVYLVVKWSRQEQSEFLPSQWPLSSGWKKAGIEAESWLRPLGRIQIRQEVWFRTLALSTFLVQGQSNIANLPHTETLSESCQMFCIFC